ncbi:TcdA/TcdB pore-forming domain-containing protein [Pseudomonas marginalis]|uniref:TcdA/TcdB pore-forming domain-containing protein n=1 Tax=Pseudomonas marginalis TaxID=298 RepID=UPI003B9EB3F3
MHPTLYGPDNKGIHNKLFNKKKYLHTVWVGGPLPVIAKSYLGVWKTVDPKKIYTPITWVDTDNMLVALYNKAVKTLRTELLNTSLESNPAWTAVEYYEKAVVFEKSIRELHPHSNDQERKDTIQLLADSLSPSQKVEYQQQIDFIENEKSAIIEDHRNKKYQEVSSLFETFSKKEPVRGEKLRAIYNKELNDRGNLAAASDLIRFIALYEHGGVYIDMDLLPTLNWDLIHGSGLFLVKPVTDQNTQNTSVQPLDRIYGADIYIEIEKFLNLPGSKTIRLRSRLNEEQIAFIQNHMNSNQLFKPLEVLSSGDFHIANTRDGYTNSQMGCEKSNLFPNRMFDAFIDGYAMLEMFNKALGFPVTSTTETHKVENEIDKQFEERDINYAIISKLRTYYQDSIFPRQPIETATLALTGPAIVGTLIGRGDTGDAKIKDTCIASLDTVEEKFSSWAIEQDVELAFVLEKSKLGVGITPQEARKTRTELFHRLDSRVSLTPDAINFLHRLDNFSPEEVKTLQQAAALSDAYLTLSAHAEALIDSLAGVGIEHWTRPSVEQLHIIAEQHGAPEFDSFHYEKQLIVQLQGDDVCFQSAQSLFSKHPKQSEWLQLGDTLTPDVLTWSEPEQTYLYTSPLVLENEGAVRIILVGHGTTTDGTPTLGGMNLEKITQTLSGLFESVGGHLAKATSLKLNLVGCTLYDATLPITDTLPGQVAQWMKKQSETLGIFRDQFSIVAYQYPLRVTENGKKEIYFNGHWLDKEVAAIEGLLTKVELSWDVKTDSIIMLPISMPEIAEAAHGIDAAMMSFSQLSAASQKQLNVLHEMNSQQIRKQLFLQDKPASYRTDVEKNVIQALTLTNLSQEWNEAAADLHASNNLDKEWHASFTTRPIETGHEVLFIHETTGDYQWLPTQEDIFKEFGSQHEQLSALLGSTLQLDSASGHISAKPGIGEAEAIHTLNAAFLLQAIMGEHDTALSWSSQLQNYVGLIQPSLGLVEDVAHLASLVTSAMSIEIKPLTQALTLLHAAAPALSVAGLFLDAANIVGIIGDLANTKDPVVIATSSTNLVLAGLSSGVNVAAIVTSFIPAAAGAGALLGLVAVPLAGISAGLPALVSGFSTIAKSCQDTFDEFDRVQAQVATPSQLHIIGPKDATQPLWGFAEGAVITEINFQNNTVQYGNVTMMGTQPGSGSGHTRVGGFDSYFSGPALDTRAKLDVYAGLGVDPKLQPINMADTVLLSLPSGLNKHYTFDYDYYSFHRGAAAPALRRLSAYHGKALIWHFNAFVSDYAVCHLAFEASVTAINVTLDNNNRTLILPAISDDDARSKLSYHMVGGGGKYELILAYKPLAIEISASPNASEQWTIDVEYVLKATTIKDGKVVLGGLQPALLKTMNVSSSELRIGNQRITFATNHSPDELLLLCRLDLPTQNPTQQKLLQSLSLGINVNLKTAQQQRFLIFASDGVQPMRAQVLAAAANALELSGILQILVNGKNGLLNISEASAAWVGSAGPNSIWFSQNTVSREFCIPGKVQLLSSAHDILLTTTFKPLPSQQGDLAFTFQSEYNHADINLVLNSVDVDDHVAIKELDKLLDAPFEAKHFVSWINGMSGTACKLEAGAWRLAEDMPLRTKTAAGKQLAFVYKNQLAAGSTMGHCVLTSAHWLAPDITFTYSMAPAPVFIINATHVTTLALSPADIDLKWRAAHTELILNVSTKKATSALILPHETTLFSKTLILMPENSAFELTLSGIRFTKDMFRLVGLDLAIQYGSGSMLVIANAIKPGVKLIMHFENQKNVTVDEIIATAFIDSEFAIKEVNKYFTLENITTAFEREDKVIQFTGPSGLNYEMRPNKDEFSILKGFPYRRVLTDYQGAENITLARVETSNYIPAIIAIATHRALFKKAPILQFQSIGNAENLQLYWYNRQLTFSTIEIQSLISRKILTVLSNSDWMGGSHVYGECTLDISGLYATPQCAVDLIGALERDELSELIPVVAKWLVSLKLRPAESAINAGILAEPIAYEVNEQLAYHSGQPPILSWETVIKP